MNRNFYTSNGFTIVELLTAIIISSIVVSTVYTTYFFGLKHLRHFRHQSHLEREAALIFQTIGNDLTNSKRINGTGTKQLSILCNDGKYFEYSFEANGLFRNNFQMNAPDVTILQFLVEEDQPKQNMMTSPAFSWGRSFEKKTKHKVIHKPTYNVLLRLMHQEKQIFLQTHICPRNGHLKQFEINK